MLSCGTVPQCVNAKPARATSLPTNSSFCSIKHVPPGQLDMAQVISGLRTTIASLCSCRTVTLRRLTSANDPRRSGSCVLPDFTATQVQYPLTLILPIGVPVKPSHSRVRARSMCHCLRASLCRCPGCTGPASASAMPTSRSSRTRTILLIRLFFGAHIGVRAPECQRRPVSFAASTQRPECLSRIVASIRRWPRAAGAVSSPSDG